MEKMYCTSPVTGITYCPEDSIHIANPKQVLFYLCKGLTIQDVFPSKNYTTGDKILVFTIDKKESQEMYKTWKNNVKVNPSILEGVELKEQTPDQIRVLNLKQVIFYLENQAQLVDVCPMQDRFTNDPVLGFVFNKTETAHIYREWKKIKARS